MSASRIDCAYTFDAMPKPTRLTHLNSRGQATMVNVGAKIATAREAIAEGVVQMRRETLAAISSGSIPKGDVFAAARLAGILAAKKTGELIPLCHPLPIESVSVEFELPKITASKKSSESVDLRIRATASITAKTGVEMEALTAVAMAALTIYDMCKAIDRAMSVREIKLIRKTGGKTDFDRDAVETKTNARPKTGKSHDASRSR